jgi:hypothetical protein
LDHNLYGNFTAQDRAARIKKEYVAFKEGPPELLEEMYSDLMEHGKDPANLLPALTRVRHTVDGAQASATKLTRDNEGVFVFTIVVYAGDDQAARQASSIVIGESLGRELVQENYVDIRKTLNGVADTIRYVVFHL